MSRFLTFLLSLGSQRIAGEQTLVSDEQDDVFEEVFGDVFKPDPELDELEGQIKRRKRKVRLAEEALRIQQAEDRVMQQWQSYENGDSVVKIPKRRRSVHRPPRWARPAGLLKTG